MERVTLLLCANMAGTDKRKLVLIGKSRHPRCFKNVSMKSLPVVYKFNQSAWMTRCIFISWLEDWDRELAKTKRHFLLLMDNATSHPKLDTTDRHALFKERKKSA